MRRSLVNWIAAIFLCETLLCLGQSRVIKPDDKVRTLRKVESSTEFKFEKNSPDYSVVDSKLFDTIRIIALSKPKFEAGTGFDGLSVWANIQVKQKTNMSLDHKTYIATLYNQAALSEDHNSVVYRISMLRISEKIIQNDTSIFRVAGYYDEPLLIEQLIDAVCTKNDLQNPKMVSAKEQFAPSTTAWYSDTEDSDFKRIGELAKDAKPLAATDVDAPVASIRVAPLQHIILKKKEFLVEIFASPGQIRISESWTEDDGVKKSKILGFVHDDKAWLMLCGKYSKGPVERASPD